ncbi:hypothetical protein [uncultured Sneathiella sp.]|jgi:hypothetical protein|uniref:hypothetical protein n=1 Tax=uncultured Sneathiella sp. TaxID=879315 RepID=UPI0030D6DD31|tara:strand:- start:405 stop:620 length:216 start_codon:yes stop_codon:yes gene_type:complete
MIMRFALTVRDFGLDLLVAIFLLWVVFLVLLDLGAFVVTGNNTPTPEIEETPVPHDSQSGCVAIDGIKICD